MSWLPSHQAKSPTQTIGSQMHACIRCVTISRTSHVLLFGSFGACSKGAEGSDTRGYRLGKGNADQTFDKLQLLGGPRVLSRRMSHLTNEECHTFLLISTRLRSGDPDRVFEEYAGACRSVHVYSSTCTHKYLHTSGWHRFPPWWGTVAKFGENSGSFHCSNNRGY